jgi:hypothetical protein
MRTLLRFSAAVAFSRDRRQRWRQICLLCAAFISTLATLIAIGLIVLSIVSPIRAGSVTGILTGPDKDGVSGISSEGAVAAEVDRGTLAMGRQVPTVWIEPMPGHEDDPAAVPKGLGHMLAPGESVLSPALLDAGYTAESFGWDSSSAGTGAGGAIGDEGLAAASEPLIFVRPGPGQTLGEGGAISYVASFARSDPEAIYGGNALDPEVVGASMMIPGALILLVVPGFVLLVSSSRARSPVRDGRLRFLYVMGVRPGTARTAMACETGLLAAAGSLLAVLVYALVGPQLTVIPATSIRVFPGDLAPPWWTYVPTVVAVIGCALVCGAMGRINRRPRTARPRAGHTIALIGLVLALAVVIASASSWVDPSASSTMFFAGTFAVVVFLPLAIPRLCAAVASMMRQARSPVLWASARRLVHDSVHLSRVASVLGVLIVVVSFAVSLWGSAAATQAEASGSDDSRAVSASWRGDPDNGIEAARHAFAAQGKDVLIVSLIGQEDEHGGLPTLVDIDDCTGFVDFFGGDPDHLCAAGNAAELSDFARTHTGMRTPDKSSHPVPDNDLGDDVMIFPKGSLSTQDVQRALGFLPALNVDVKNSDLTAPLPLMQWLVAGALTAFALLTLAIVREIGDRSVEDADRDRLYQSLGLSLRATDRLAWTVLLIPLATSAITAFICSLVISYAGQVLLIAKGDLLKLTLVAGISFILPIAAILVTIPVRRAAALLRR